MEVKFSNGEVRDLPSHEAALALASGEGQVRPDAKIPVVDSYGTVAEVGPEEFLKGAASGDYTPMGEAAYALHQRQQDVGAMDMAAGVGLGLADKLSLGALPAAAVAVGGEDARQNILAMREQTPGSVTAGEVGGMVLPALFAGGRGFTPKTGATAAGEGSLFSFTPSGAVARLGTTVERGAMNLMESRLGAPTSLLGAVGRRGLAMGLGGATEGAIWGGATALSEANLYNRPISAESLMWGNEGGHGNGLLTGALWGGAGGALVGGVVGGAGYGLQRGADALRAGAKRTAEVGSEVGTAIRTEAARGRDAARSFLGRRMVGNAEATGEELAENLVMRTDQGLGRMARKYNAKSMGANKALMQELRAMREGSQPGVAKFIDDFASGELAFQRAKGARSRPWTADAALDDLEVVNKQMKSLADQVEDTAERLAASGDRRFIAHMKASDAVASGLPPDSPTLGRSLREELRSIPNKDVTKELRSDLISFYNSVSKDAADGGLSLRVLRLHRIKADNFAKASSGLEKHTWLNVRKILEGEAERLTERMSADVPGFASQYKHFKTVAPAVTWLNKALVSKHASLEAASLMDSYSVIAMLWGGPIDSALMAGARKAFREYGDAGIAHGAAWARRKMPPQQEVLKQIEKMTRKTESTVKKAMGSFVKRMRDVGRDVKYTAKETTEAAGRKARAVGRPIPGLPQRIGTGYGSYESREKKQKEINEKAAKIKEKLAAIQADPDSLLSDVAALAGPLDEHAPSVYGELSATMARAYNVLRRYAPVDRGPDYLLVNQDPKFMNPAEARKLVRVAEILDDPVKIFDKIENGQVTKEEMDAIKEVYPNIFSVIQTALIDEISNGDIHPSYEDRVKVSLITGVPTSYTMTRTSIISSQMTYKPAEKIETRAVGSDTPKRPLDMASDMRTEITIQEAGGRF